MVTEVPLTNGDGLNVLVKREVVGFRANIAEPKGEFEEDGQKRYRYRVEPNEMPEGLHKLRPNHPLSRNLDHNWQQALQRTSAERRVGVEWHAVLREQRLALTATSEEGVSVQVALTARSAKPTSPSRPWTNCMICSVNWAPPSTTPMPSSWTPRRRTSSPTRSSRPCAAKPSRR